MHGNDNMLNITLNWFPKFNQIYSYKNNRNKNKHPKLKSNKLSLTIRPHRPSNPKASSKWYFTVFITAIIWFGYWHICKPRIWNLSYTHNHIYHQELLQVCRYSILVWLLLVGHSRQDQKTGLVSLKHLWHSSSHNKVH